ncbi:MAG: DNA/RNA non-specific endonuclease [Ruminococcus sp.]|nr:DNA/RNA non-specific endonuclease [Ruminococcus sp.]
MKKLTALILALLCAVLCACSPGTENKISFDLSNIPEYTSSAYVELNGNKPEFSEKDKTKTKSFEKYSRLDRLGRCGVAYANISTDLMPTKERESISSVKPTGWEQNTYTFIENGYVYNRCHLIGYQLTGENANERNLITGTRYMNVEGMLPFENKVAEYVTSTKNHVLYRVTPVFDGDNLLANGVEMEAWSVEDSGKGVCFNVFCYNVQPGVVITYSSGKNVPDKKYTVKSYVSGNKSKAITARDNTVKTYILNTSSNKFHLTTCDAVKKMKEKNRKTYKGTRSSLIKDGYEPCGMCNP